MSTLYLDILLCAMTYCFLIGVIIYKKRKNRPSGDNGDDDDGGLPISNVPDLDLPPGVSLPGGGPSKKIEEYEEAFA